MIMNTKKIKTTTTEVVALVAGVAAGSWLKKQFGGAQLLGEGSSANKYVVPSVLTIAGAVASAMTENEIMRPAALGVAAVGGAGLVNELAGRSVVALGNAGGALPVTSGRIAMPRRIPQQTPVRGVAPSQPALPGIGMTSEVALPGVGVSGTNGVGKCVSGCF